MQSPVLQQKKRNGRRHFGRTLRYISGYWQTKGVLTLLVINTILENFVPAIIGSIIDVVENVALGTPIPEGKGISGLTYSLLNPLSTWVSNAFNVDSNIATLGVFSFTIIVVAVVSGVLNYLMRYASSYISQMGSFQMRSDLYNSLLKQSFSFYDQQRTGQLMSRATSDINRVGRFFNFGLRMIISSGLLSVLVVYSLLTIDFGLTVLTFALMPFALFTVMRYAQLIRPLWDRIREQYGNITSVLQENLTGIRVVKGFARESYEEEKFAEKNLIYFETNLERAKVQAFYLSLTSLITALGGILIIWYGGNQVIRGALTLGSLVAFYFYIQRLRRPVRTIGMMTSMMQRAFASADRVFEIIDAEVEVSDKEGAIQLEEIEGRVAFEAVGFSYDGVNMVLQDINLIAEPGKSIAILGATGSGKTSIINLVPRFYDVTHGRITIDGYDIRDITVKSLRKHISVVRQDPFIFSTTLMENIAFGVEDAGMEDITEAATRAKIADFIQSLPEGYATRVGERGVTLSGGQKQRLAIARALLKNPKILILDDSTSSVDTSTEFEIQRALQELLKDRTTFIITQRLSSVKDADYIIVLEDGQIAEEGTHEELLTKNGIYSKLYRTQILDTQTTEED